MNVVTPRDENDPFCTCPKCGLLGSHGLVAVETERIERRMTHPDMPGQSITPSARAVRHHQRSGWVLDTGSQHQAQRTCVFCQHVWRTEFAAVG